MKKETFLAQWVGKDSPAAQGPAKQHEFSIYIPPLLAALKETGAKDIIDFQADEGVVSVAFCAQSPENHATFVLPSAEDDLGGIFKKMAEEITEDVRYDGKITLATSTAEIKTAQADAILFNNILGCQGSLQNIDVVLEEAARMVKPGGYAFVTVPNPDGREFSSYKCDHLPENREHGGTYDFQMEGETEVFKNLYLTQNGLTEAFSRQGFSYVSKHEIADKPYQSFQSQEPAFIQYKYCKPV